MTSQEKGEKGYSEHVNKMYTDLASEVSTLKPEGRCACSCKKEAEKSAQYAKGLGYSEADLELAQKLDIKLCLGCGDPVTVVELHEGEVGMDLGSGGGFDAFKAARIVGTSGKVVGIDANEAMITLARKKAEIASGLGITNVEFIQGALEKLPLPDNFATAAWSNCVFNLAADKQMAIKEVFRTLQPGGRFIYSDVIALGEMTEELKKEISMQTCCISRATPVSQLEEMLKNAGFENIKIQLKDSREYLERWTGGTKHEAEAKEKVKSAYVYAYKPKN
jgi:SAM-dependent methyltransferase